MSARLRTIGVETPAHGDFEPERRLLSVTSAVNIRFTSSLTSEDENLVAPAVLNALSSILDLIPIAYTLRIETTDAHVYQHSRPTSRLAMAEEQIRPTAEPAVVFDS
jgi:hypothetical protein